MAEHGGLTASIATLAVFAQSSCTLADAATELAKWPGAHWPRPTAHKHVPVLARKGLLRMVARGITTSLDRYEITPLGEGYRRAWLQSHAVGPPKQRDTALGKVRLCKSLEEVSSAIDAIRAEEEMYERAYLETHARRVAARRARRRQPERPDDLGERLDEIGTVGEAALWDGAKKRLERTREELEGLLNEFSGELR